MDVDKIVQEVKALTPEQIKEELLNLRVRQYIQRQQEKLTTVPMKCERCNDVIEVGKRIFDVAVSIQELPEDIEQLEWDPQDETYICESCGIALQQFLSAED